MELKIEGMHCGACVRRVTQALEKTPGVKVESVVIGAAVIATADAESALAALRKAGYAAQPAP
jgi:copper chaperone CopZ